MYPRPSRKNRWKGRYQTSCWTRYSATPWVQSATRVGIALPPDAHRLIWTALSRRFRLSARSDQPQMSRTARTARLSSGQDLAHRRHACSVPIGCSHFAHRPPGGGKVHAAWIPDRGWADFPHCHNRNQKYNHIKRMPWPAHESRQSSRKFPAPQGKIG